MVTLSCVINIVPLGDIQLSKHVFKQTETIGTAAAQQQRQAALCAIDFHSTPLTLCARNARSMCINCAYYVNYIWQTICQPIAALSGRVLSALSSKSFNYRVREVCALFNTRQASLISFVQTLSLRALLRNKRRAQEQFANRGLHLVS